MKKLSRILFFLALTALILSSCSQSTEEAEAPAQAENPEAAAAVEEEKEPTVWDTVTETYAGYDYEGAEFHILAIDPGRHGYSVISSEANEVWYPEQTGEVYTDAVCIRNAAAEDLLNINIVPIWGGENASINPYIKHNVQAGDHDVDFALDTLPYSINLGVDSFICNLYDIDTLELDSPWWDAEIVSTFSYRKQLLFPLAGHYNICDDFAVPVIFYNKQVVTEFDLEAPNELVRSGEWTLEKMMESAETVAVDLDGDGKMSAEKDSFGYLDNGGAAMHLMSGLNEVNSYLDEEGIPHPACEKESYINAAEMIFTKVVNSPATLQTGENSINIELFKANRALFYYEVLGPINQFRDMEEDFSLLPLPKRNVEQESYTSLVYPAWCTVLVVPVTCPDMDRVGVVMDVLSGYSTDTVNRTLYELLLGAKLVRDEETTVMLDYVLDAKTYDWGEGFSWFNSIGNAFSSLKKNTSFTLASSMKKLMKSAAKNLDRICEKMDAQIDG